MGRKCSVKSCLSDSTRREDLGVTFHKVPLHPDIRPKWLQLCKISDEKKVIYVCSRHFLRADFCNFKGKKYMLKQGVLPSIFSWNKSKLAPTTSVTIKTENEDSDNQMDTLETPDELDDKKEIKLESNLDEKPDTIKSETLTDVIEAKDANIQPLQIKIEIDDIKEEILSPSHSTTIEQKIKTLNTSTGSLTFVPNTRIEALDFNQSWSPATILEVDYEENEVLVHFDSYSNKYDEWISINSSSIRALNADIEKAAKKPAEVFEEGERCMASWSDARKFAATITKVIDSTTYEVLFDDGYAKTLKSHRISKSSSTAPQASPMFQPARGPKEERKNKKRKINVSNLFKKRTPSNMEAGNALNESTVESDKGEWFPSWENGRPIGIASHILRADNYRESVIVPDPRIPHNWVRHLTQRMGGKWDTIFVSPEGKRFRLKSEIRAYIQENPHLHLSESMFSFVPTKLKARRRNNTNNSNAATPTSSESPIPTATTISNEEDAMKTPVKKPNLTPLKILQIDGGYKCPIDGCGKSFRRENLAQMHVKHYHPKFTKFLDSTPNVADLAYARTVGENLDRSPNSERPYKEVKPIRPNKPLTVKASKASPEIQPDQGPSIETQKDTEIIKLLNSKPFEINKPLESSPSEPLPSGLPPSMYPDIKLKDLLVKCDPVPKENEITLKTLSTVTTTPSGLKTLLPVKKDDGSRKDIKRKRIMSENMDSPKQIHQDIEVPPVPEPSDTIIEGGEVIKIVRMRQEEIINCTCGITEEDGLMIQCELCLCWQHAYCNNIQRENEVPEKYICYICQNPAKQRNSKKYMHDQDWMKHGTLPTASYHCKDPEAQSKRFEKLKISHDISGGLLELKDFMHSLKLKIKIAEAKNHPKLYLWSKQWEKLPLPEKQETKPDIKPEIFPKVEESQGESMLLTLLKSNKDNIKKEELAGFPKIDINSLIENNLESIHAPIIPQPEAAIESADCRLNLLDHIAHCQNLIEERLEDFEKQIDELDPSLVNDYDDNYARIRHTTSMLLRDLNTLKEFSQITTF